VSIPLWSTDHKVEASCTPPGRRRARSQIAMAVAAVVGEEEGPLSGPLITEGGVVGFELVETVLLVLGSKLEDSAPSMGLEGAWRGMSMVAGAGKEVSGT